MSAPTSSPITKSTPPTTRQTLSRPPDSSSATSTTSSCGKESLITGHFQHGGDRPEQKDPTTDTSRPFSSSSTANNSHRAIPITIPSAALLPSTANEPILSTIVQPPRGIWARFVENIQTYMKEKATRNLHEAMLANNPALVLKLLTRALNIQQNVSFQQNNTHISAPPLVWAVLNNHINVLINIIEKLKLEGLNFDSSINAALLHSAELGFEESSRLLIENEANINTKDKNDNTPLIIAASHAHEFIVILLIENGADLNAQNTEKNSALMCAILKENQQIFRFLIGNNKLNLNIVNINGENALILALKKGQTNFAVSIITININNNSDMNNKEGSIALFLTFTNRYFDISQLLITQTNINLETKDSEENSPLNWLIKNNNFDLAVSIIEKTIIDGINIDKDKIYNSVDNAGNSPLINAVIKENSELVDLLITHNTDLNLINKNEDNAVILALRLDQNTLAQSMIKSGRVDLNAKNKSSETTLTLAIEKNDLSTVDLILREEGIFKIEASHKDLALMKAIEKGNIEIVQLLVENGADINAKIYPDDSALLLALNSNHTQIAAFLIKNGAALDVQDKDGNTPLILSIKMGNIELIKLILIREKKALSANPSDRKK